LRHVVSRLKPRFFSVDLTSDFFSLFQLPRLFRLDLAELEARYLALQGEAHPDRFARADERTRRLSMQMTTRINEACRALKEPLARARHLLSLAGHDLEAEKNTGMDADFLMKQMEWRETLEAARRGGDHPGLEGLRRRLAQELRARYQNLAVCLDDRRDFMAAAGQVRQLMFLEKLRGDIDDALAFLEDGGA
jgi:molecular chaperone HscB